MKEHTKGARLSTWDKHSDRDKGLSQDKIKGNHEWYVKEKEPILKKIKIGSKKTVKSSTHQNKELTLVVLNYYK